ncbi:hypothetical protein JCM10213_008579 [Rhodosporidiobolus nylandii]
MSRRSRNLHLSDLSDSSDSDAGQALAAPSSAAARGWTMRSLPVGSSDRGGGSAAAEQQAQPEPLVKASRKTGTDKSRGQYASLAASDPPSSSRSSRRSRRADAVAAGEPASASPSAQQFQDYPDAQRQNQQGYMQGSEDEEAGEGEQRGSQKSPRSRLKWALGIGAVLLVVVAAIIIAIAVINSHSSSDEDAEPTGTLASDHASSASSPSSASSALETALDSSANEAANAGSTSDAGESSLADGLSSSTGTATHAATSEGEAEASSLLSLSFEPFSPSATSSGLDLNALTTEASGTTSGVQGMLESLQTSLTGLASTGAGVELQAPTSLSFASLATPVALPSPIDRGTPGASPATSGVVMPTDAVILDPMTTDDGGNLVFTFTTSLDLDGAGTAPAAFATTPAVPTGGNDGAGAPSDETDQAGGTHGSDEPNTTFDLSASNPSPTLDPVAPQSSTPPAPSASPSKASKVFKTTAIFYSKVNWIGACGKEIKDDTQSIALPLALYPGVETVSSLCGESVLVRNPTSGTLLNLTVLDASNRTDYSIFTPAVFEALGGDLNTGELQVQYRFVNGRVELPADKEEGQSWGETENAGAEDGHDNQESSPSSDDHDTSPSSDSNSNDQVGLATEPMQLAEAAVSARTSTKTTTPAPAVRRHQTVRVVALPSKTYAGGKYCGKKIRIIRTSANQQGENEGRQVVATVTDECPTCENANSLDLSVGAYQALGGTQAEGQFSVSWKFEAE